MKRNFQLTAIAIALTSMSSGVIAVTTNTSDNLYSPDKRVISGDTIPSSFTPAAVGNIGFSQQSVTNSVPSTTGNPNATIQKYDAGSNGNPFAYTLYSVRDSSSIKYYTDPANTGVLVQATVAELATISGLPAGTLNYTGDKTGQIFTSTQVGQTTSAIAVVNQKQTSYISAVNKSTTTNLDNASLTNSTGASPAPTPDPTNGQILVNLGGLLSNQSVTTGILVDASGSPLTDANGSALGTTANPVYGTQASITAPSTSPSATAGQTVTSTSLLTGNGLQVTYNDQDPVVATTTVDNNGFSSTKQVTDTSGNVTADHTVNLKNDGSGLVVTDNQTGTSTLVTSTGITTGNVTAASITLAGADLATTLATEATTREKADVALNGRVDQEVIDRKAGDVALNDRVVQEVSDRKAGDVAIRNGIATKVTTRALEVNGPTNLNGPVTVNNVSATTTVNQAGTPVTVPSFGTTLDAEGRPTTLVQNREKTDIVTVDSTTQKYNQSNLIFSSKVEKGSIKTNETFTAGIAYDANGVAAYGQNTPLGVTADPQLEVVSEDTIILGKESASSSNGLVVRNKDVNGVSTSTSLTAAGIATTGNLNVDGVVTGAGFDARDTATLASANKTTADTAVAIRSEAAAETVRVNSAISTGDAATLASANQTTADTATAIRSEATAEKTRVNGELANATTDRAAIRTEFSVADTEIRKEAAAETVRVNSAISTGDASTLASSKAYTDTSSVTTLAAANSYTDNRANQMNHRLDDVEKTAYRGVAIALAAQQAIPNLKPGNFAVYGGVGHYEGENAGALGVATLLGNGRTSINAAFGFASSQVGGRIGVSYVFGD